MPLFENFPYTNFHEMNLDWILQELKKLVDEWDSFGGNVSATAHESSDPEVSVSGDLKDGLSFDFGLVRGPRGLTGPEGPEGPEGPAGTGLEILDEYVPTMRVDHMEYDDTYYHATLFMDEQRINYLYDEDQNGRYLIRNGDNVENDTESDYFFTHFALQMPQVAGGEVYLFGDLTNNRIDEEYKMTYNLIDHQYELVTPLKQGSYNYMYMFLHDGDAIGETKPCEGDFHQTENEYAVYVYHRPFGLRYDKLIGFKNIKFKE